MKPYVPVITADDAVKRMGGNVSPAVRRVLDALYGTEGDKKIASVIDCINENIKSQNSLQEIFDEQDEQLAEIRESSKRLQEDQDQVYERLKRLERSPYL